MKSSWTYHGGFPVAISKTVQPTLLFKKKKLMLNKENKAIAMKESVDQIVNE